MLIFGQLRAEQVGEQPAQRYRVHHVSNVYLQRAPEVDYAHTCHRVALLLTLLDLRDEV